MDVRKVYFVNQDGDRINCLLRSSFFNDLQGLGFANEYNMLSPKDGFYTITEQQTVQPSISGIISFIDRKTAYKDYRTLTSWINRATELSIAYAPYDNIEYFIDVAIDSVSKGELDTGGYLSCDISFLALTPWYSANPATLSFDESILHDIKRYDYNYSYKYVNTTTPGELDFTVSGDYDAAIYFVAQGGLEDPVLTLLNKSTGAIIGQVDLTGLTVNDNQQLVFATTKKRNGIWIKEGTNYTDIIDQVILTPGVEVFFNAPRNTDLTIRFTVSGTLQTATSLTLYEYYKTR